MPKTMGTLPAASLAEKVARPCVTMTSNFFSDQFSYQLDSPGSIFRASVLNDDILSLHIAEVAKPLAKCLEDEPDVRLMPV